LFGRHSLTAAHNASSRRLQLNQDGLWVWLPLTIGTPGNFRVAFHTGEDLHFVGMVAGLGGTTEQVHLSAAGWAREPIFDAKGTRSQHANWAFAVDCMLGCGHRAPLDRTRSPVETIGTANRKKSVQYCSPQAVRSDVMRGNHPPVRWQREIRALQGRAKKHQAGLEATPNRAWQMAGGTWARGQFVKPLVV
jgi:hypothetical protein